MDLIGTLVGFYSTLLEVLDFQSLVKALAISAAGFEFNALSSFISKISSWSAATAEGALKIIFYTKVSQDTTLGNRMYPFLVYYI